MSASLTAGTACSSTLAAWDAHALARLLGRGAAAELAPQGPAGLRRSRQATLWPSAAVGASSGSMRLWPSRTYGQRGGSCTGRGHDERRRPARDGHERLVTAAAEPRTDLSSPHVYGCSGVAKIASFGVLDDPPGVHHRDLVGHLGDDPQVVRIMTIAVSSSACSRWISSRIWAWTVTSSAVVGSSAMSSLGCR